MVRPGDGAPADGFTVDDPGRKSTPAGKGAGIGQHGLPVRVGRWRTNEVRSFPQGDERCSPCLAECVRLLLVRQLRFCR